MRCATCGADLPTGAMFCGECGRAVHALLDTPLPESENETRIVPVVEDEDEGEGEMLRSEPDQDDLDEATRLPVRQSAPPSRFVLHFSTGETVTVQGSGLIGRRPSAQPGEYFDEYVSIDDPGRSVSKTHLEYGQDGGVLWISDRFSANGTVVREPDRPARLCPGGRRSRVPRGSRVEIGEQFFIVG